MGKTEILKTIEYGNIGRVNFIRKASVRNLKITIEPFRNVRVTVPYFISFETACNFVREKQEWIKRSQEKWARYRNVITFFKEGMPFKTIDHTLVMGRHSKSTIQTLIKDGQIMIIYPVHADIKDPRIQKAIRKAIHAAWRIEAVKYLPNMLENLALKYRFIYTGVTFRDNKTRWGSCSRNDNISLNIHLMRLPEHLREYVLLHELCHTLHKHHQKAFWQLLNSITAGRARQLDKELNKYSPEIW